MPGAERFLHLTLGLCWKTTRDLKFARQKAEFKSTASSQHGQTEDVLQPGPRHCLPYPASLSPRPPARSVVSAAPAQTAASASRFSACGLLLGTAVPCDAAAADAPPTPAPTHTQGTSTLVFFFFLSFLKKNKNKINNKANSIKAESFIKTEIRNGLQWTFSSAIN